MAKRVRYTEENPIPVRIEYKDNGADRDEQRLTSEEAAIELGVAKQTLLRWWRKMRFPDHPEVPEAYEPDEEYKGGQMRLLWPMSVVTRLKELLGNTADVAGKPGAQRLPHVTWKAAAKW